jgi:hypothetical protein
MGLRPTHGNEKRHNTRLLILSNLHSVFRRGGRAQPRDSVNREGIIPR